MVKSQNDKERVMTLEPMPNMTAVVCFLDDLNSPADGVYLFDTSDQAMEWMLEVARKLGYKGEKEGDLDAFYKDFSSGEEFYQYAVFDCRKQAGSDK